jgi:hydroxymethylpyrimidine pyrophosphatase-like HAD family hydrolase
MLKACELVGIDPANTYAFGDSENDIDMLEAAAHGVAMGNGTDRAKAAANYVTTAFDEDGIYKGLKHFGLI